ncbi:MAG: VOC family protein [Terriglobales bacterium]
MISRRTFLALTGCSLLAPRIAYSADEVPALLDHILLGCHDLDQGIAFVEENTGVRAAFGGVHPGRGTRNALLSLGEHCYLEVIAPDPEQKDIQASAVPLVTMMKRLTSPRLIGWAVHPGEIQALGERLRQSGVAIRGPVPGSRTRADGRVLSWKTLVLEDDHHGLLPFFIEWDVKSVHPSADAPKGCRLERFTVAGPDPGELSKTFLQLGIQVPVAMNPAPQLQARIVSAKGNFDVSS